MVFYNYIFAIALIFTFLHKTATVTNTDLVYPICGLIAPSPTSIGLMFYVKINNTSDRNNYDVEITPDECCLEEGEVDEVDCDSLKIIGGCTDYVPKGGMKTVKVVAPLLNQYERKGYCTVFVDSKSNNGQNKRDTIKVTFDTTFYNDKFDTMDNYNHCEHKDEDPLNNCRPVKCDTYYNGKKPHFSRKVKRCVAVPLCLKDDDYDYPSIIYNPQNNLCLEESIVNEDLEYIKTSNKGNGKKRKSNDVLITNNFHQNTTSSIPKDIIIDDLESIKPYQQEQEKTNSDENDQNLAMQSYDEVNSLTLFLKKYFVNNKWTSLILVLVIIVQCLLICTMFYCLSKTCCCCNKKKVVRKIFNYRQDASMTTPLINTSNIETETTEYQYLTESSNKIDQKIKCYKACQKENSNVKKSMSDDILSKLLNRRDWRNFQSQVSPEPENNIEEILKITPLNNKVNNLPKAEKKTHNEAKVVFEDEKLNNITSKKQLKSINRLNDADTIAELKGSGKVEANLSSEKEIKSVSYNNFDVAGYRATLPMNKGVFKDKKSKKETNSIEKGAQAYFSNDSIDDFLSERGVIYLAGENMSKYTISSDSNDIKPSLTSSGSSKTSKNFVKNVLSLLHKKSKQGPSSDPGKNKDIDLELIHMSRASVYSSTNDSECVNNFKRKDSRTSF